MCLSKVVPRGYAADSVPLTEEASCPVVNLHTRGIYPSYDRVDSLLPDGMRGAYIEEIVRENREMSGIPKHHAATAKAYLPP